MELSEEIKNENEKKYNTFNSEELDDNVLENPACIKEDYIGFWTAVVDIIRFYLPAAANSIIQGCIGIMDYVFLGYYTKNPAITAALGLGFTCVNVMVKLILSGLLNGLECLASQAYGREDFKLCELYLNMCRYSVLLIVLIETMLVLFCDKIFVLLGQNPEVANEAWKFLLFLFPATTFNCLFDCNRVYLVCCKVKNPNTYINIAQVLIHCALLLIFTIIFDFSLLGVGISRIISSLLAFVALEKYTLLFDEEHLKSKWIMMNKEMLRNLKTFASVCIPCSGIAFLYWMPLEIITMIVGLFGIPQFAAISIVNNIQFIFNDIYRSLDLACCAHVGNCLGMNLPNKAKSYAWISLLLAYSASLITTILILILKDYVMLAFTSDVEITKALNSIYFIFLISFACNCGSFVLSIILDVCGYRMLLMFLVCVMYWLICPPFAYLITFQLNFGFVGLYAVYTSAVLIDCIIQALVIVCIDWRGTADTASKRIEYEHND